MKRLFFIALTGISLCLVSCSEKEKETFYAVTFNADGGTPAPEAQKVKAGGAAAAPSPNPETGVSSGDMSDNSGTAGKLPLMGLTFVVTGTLPGVGRRDIENQIESLGGRAAGSVSKKTDYVIAGDDAGSKLSKALELGIKVIGYDEYLKIINDQ